MMDENWCRSGVSRSISPWEGGLLKKSSLVQAVNGLDFDIYAGETLGLVGESGCGKSTTGRTILQLYKPTEGSVLYNDVDITTLSREGCLNIGRRCRSSSQDPYSSLNPRLTVGNIISEPLMIHHTEMGEGATDRVCQGIAEPGESRSRICQ